MFFNYLRISMRNLLKNRVFTVINVGGLALGMAACLNIFYYVGYEFSYDEFFPDSEQVYRLYLERDDQDRTRTYFYLATAFQPLLMEMPEADGAFRLIQIDYQNNSLVYDEEGDKKTFQQQGMNFADGGIGSVLGLDVLEGSFEAMNEPLKVFINKTVATKFFGDAPAVGKTLTVTGNVGAYDYEVAGVMKDLPQNTHFGFNVLLSLASLDVIEGEGRTESWEGWNARVYVKSALSKQQLTAAIDRNMLGTPAFREEESTWRSNLLPLEEHYLTVVEDDGSINKSAERTLWGLAAIGMFILVIAWINFINLATTRAIERAREVGVRKVLGSHAYQLRLQFMMESFMVNVLAGVMAFTFVQITLPYLRIIANPMIIPADDQLMFWGIVLSLLLGGSLLSGLYPAFVLSGFKPVAVLRGRLSMVGSGAFLRKGLVVFQFVASTCMITGTFIVYTQIMYMKNKDLGLNIDHTLLLDAPPGSLVGDNTSFFRSVNAFKEEVVQLNAVNRITASSVVPGENIGWNAFMKRPQDDDEARKNVMLIACDHDYMITYGLELMAGRFYGEGDGTFDKGSFVINEEALGYFGFASAEEAIGQKLIEGKMFPELTIIGVVKNFHHQSLKASIEPCGFVLSLWSNYYSLALNISEDEPSHVRAEMLRSGMDEIEAIWKRFFPEAPFDYSFLDQRFDAQYRTDRQFGMIITLFAIVSVVIASLGLLGLASYSIVQRTKEIGIRKVLGASLARIFLLLTREYVTLIAVSACLAIPLAFYGMQQWLSDYAYRINISWWMLVLPILLIGSIAIITVGSQALRTAAKNPVESLRYE